VDVQGGDHPRAANQLFGERLLGQVVNAHLNMYDTRAGGFQSLCHWRHGMVYPPQLSSSSLIDLTCVSPHVIGGGHEEEWF
jgi:hypothetical protein